MLREKKIPPTSTTDVFLAPHFHASFIWGKERFTLFLPGMSVRSCCCCCCPSSSTVAVLKSGCGKKASYSLSLPLWVFMNNFAACTFPENPESTSPFLRCQSFFFSFARFLWQIGVTGRNPCPPPTFLTGWSLENFSPSPSLFATNEQWQERKGRKKMGIRAKFGREGGGK